MTWTVRHFQSGTDRRTGEPTFTIVARSGCRLLRLDKQSAADVERFDPESAWSGGEAPANNPEVTDLAATTERNPS